MQRQRAEVQPPVALTIAGSDSGGGAGVQADLKTMEAHGVFGTSVITATTAQNTQGVRGTEVLPTEHIADQYDAVTEDFGVGAVKTGMLATSEVIQTVTELTDTFAGPIVVDPVMVAATGDRLLTEAGEEAYASLIANATVVTPNVDETEVLLDRSVSTPTDARQAAATLVKQGANAALVKGGHLDSDTVVDTLVVGPDTPVPKPAEINATVETHVDRSSVDGTIVRFESPRVETDATHGSGCALSSAIAARLARGETLIDAVAGATAFAGRALRYGLDVGHGPGAIHHLVDLRERADRDPTAEAVESVLSHLETPATRPLVPDSGVAVVGATEFAESPGEVAAVEGGLVCTRDDVRAVRGVRYGAESRTTRALLSAREITPEYRFAARISADLDVDLPELLNGVVELRESPPQADVPANPDEQLARALRRGLTEAPESVCVVDTVGIGGPPGAYLFGADTATLTRRLITTREAATEG